MGRALSTLPVFAKQHEHSEIIHHLWPDSVTPILDVDTNWYHLPGGYVRREGLQPMLPYSSSSRGVDYKPPFWAQVSAPVAPIRQSCAADAPLMTRIGHGGAAYMIDYLPGEPNGWYAVAEEDGNQLGWSQSIYWQPILNEPNGVAIQQVVIDLNDQQLTVWGNNAIVLQAPCSTDSRVVPGTYNISDQKPSVRYLDTINGARYGVPWITEFGDGGILGGVYWHNHFGKPTPGMTVQVSPVIARWLYDGLHLSSEIVLIQ